MPNITNNMSPYVANCMFPRVYNVEFPCVMTSFIGMCHIIICWFSFLGIDLIIWLSMGYGTRGEDGKLWVAEVEGVVFRLRGWVDGMGSEVRKGEGKVLGIIVMGMAVS
jgi:hypothetical protein